MNVIKKKVKFDVVKDKGTSMDTTIDTSMDTKLLSFDKCKKYKHNIELILDTTNRIGKFKFDNEERVTNNLEIYEHKERIFRAGRYEDKHEYYFTQISINIINSDYIKHQLIFQLNIYDYNDLYSDELQKLILFEKIKIKNVTNMFDKTYNYDWDLNSTKTNVIGIWTTKISNSYKKNNDKLCSNNISDKHRYVYEYFDISYEKYYNKFKQENNINIKIKSEKYGDWDNNEHQENFTSNYKGM